MVHSVGRWTSPMLRPQNQGGPWPHGSGPSSQASQRARRTRACGHQDHGRHGGAGATGGLVAYGSGSSGPSTRRTQGECRATFWGWGLTRPMQRQRCGGGRPKRWHPTTVEVLRWSPAEEKRLVRLATHRGFLKNRERGERVTGADKLTNNSRGCIVHHGGERFESAWLTASGRGRCSPETKGGRHAPVWWLGEGGEVVRQAVIGSLTWRQWWKGARMAWTEAEREHNGVGSVKGATRGRKDRGVRSAAGPRLGGVGLSSARVAFGQGRWGPMTRGPRHSAGGFKTRSDLIQTDSKIFKLI
jgi:hypothetical protein